jgi:diguanylate cyclase
VHEFNGERVQLTASMGIAEVSDLNDPSAENLVKASDVALYEAKRAGRNRIVLFEPGMLTSLE